MGRKKWIGIMAATTLAIVSALAVTVRRTRRESIEAKGSCLDYAADFYWLADRALGLPFRLFTVRMAGIREGDSVLDVGCGTGALTLREKERVGRTGYVAGVDIGERMIAKAEEAAAKHGVDIDFRVASIDDLPFDRGVLDVVTSSFMVHHLPSQVKLAGFREVYRVLKPGARYLIIDFPRARGLGGKMVLAVTRFFAQLSEEAGYSMDILEGRIPQMLEAAGFEEIEELGSFRVLGVFPVMFVSARKGKKAPG